MRDRRDRVTRECERKYDLLVKEALEEERRRLSRSVFHVQTEQEQHAELVREVARTLAMQWHEENAPSWACPLPTELEWCESLIYCDYNEQRLVGYFGRSVLWNSYDYERHPVFNTFCCGVLEYRCSPPELRMDQELLQMFPPKPLAGLTTPLQWRRPGT
jgi:hypothetical protein